MGEPHLSQQTTLQDTPGHLDTVLFESSENDFISKLLQ